MKELTHRLKSPTPKFFVNLRWIVGIVGTVAIAAEKAFDFPPVVDNVLEFVGYLSSGSFLTSFLPKK